MQETTASDNKTRLIERLVVERDLTDSRDLSVELADGTRLLFNVHTVSLDEKNALRLHYNAKFPAPPVLVHNTPVGRVAQFDLQNPEYQSKIIAWQAELSKAVLATSCDLTVEEVLELEKILTHEQYSELHSTVELINGVHSEPMQTLVRDAMWAPEIESWLATYKGEPDGVKITDTVLFREMECIVAAGLTLRDWEGLSPRERMTYLEWHSFRQARESYQNWWAYSRPKEKAQKPW